MTKFRFEYHKIITGLLAVMISACMRLPDHKAVKKLSIYPEQPLRIVHFGEGRDYIHAWAAGKPENTAVLFIHGAPGSASAWKNFFRDSALQQHFHLIAADRSGYGHSNLGKPQTSVQKQAQLLAPLVEYARKSSPNLIVVGHSYGGAIAARLAMDQGEKIDYLILAAPAIDPDHEKMFRVNKPFSKAPLRCLPPAPLRVANAEKMVHAEECKAMLPDWSKIKCPTLYFHSVKDEIVPFDNLHFARQKLPPETSVFVVEEKGRHRMWIHDKTAIRKALLDWSAAHSSR